MNFKRVFLYNFQQKEPNLNGRKGTLISENLTCKKTNTTAKNS